MTRTYKFPSLGLGVGQPVRLEQQRARLALLDTVAAGSQTFEAEGRSSAEVVTFELQS